MRVWLVWLHRLEDALLALLLGGLLVVAVLQIVLRLGFDSGFSWAEPVSRMGVLWLALLGALGAARSHRHIAIDALPRLFAPFWRRAAWVVSRLATATVCALLAWYGWGMVVLEMEFPADFIPGVPSWWPMLLLPGGFALLSLRFAVGAFDKPVEHEGL